MLTSSRKVVPRSPQIVLTFSRKVDECKALALGVVSEREADIDQLTSTLEGLKSSSGAEVAARETALTGATTAALAAAHELTALKAQVADKEEAAVAAVASAAAAASDTASELAALREEVAAKEVAAGDAAGAADAEVGWCRSTPGCPRDDLGFSPFSA